GWVRWRTPGRPDVGGKRLDRGSTRAVASRVRAISTRRRLSPAACRGGSCPPPAQRRGFGEKDVPFQPGAGPFPVIVDGEDVVRLRGPLGIDRVVDEPADQ